MANFHSGERPKTSPADVVPEPVAIIGIGCRFPGGARTPGEFWDLLCRGRDCIAEIPPTRWNVRSFYDAEPGKPGRTYSKWAGLIDNIDQFDASLFGISPREAISIDPQQRWLLEMAWNALEDGGQPVAAVGGSNTGVFVGISTNDYSTLQGVEEMSRVDLHFATGCAPSIAANRISYCLNLQGPSLAVDTACSSSLVAVHLACQALQRGECDTALAAGVNVIASPLPFVAFSSMGMLSADGRCKAFDATANGFVRGEGAGAILLKPLGQALAAGDLIYAVICGTGVNQDGRTAGMLVPNGESQERLVLDVCRRAGVRPSQVQFVEAHGTGTAVGDPIEANALGRVLGRERGGNGACLIGSVKTNIGHLEAAAGIAGIIKVALALHHGQIPPSLHFNEPNPKIDFENLKIKFSDKLRPFRNGRAAVFAGVNSFGWGGTNAYALLRAPPPRPEAPPAGERQPAWLLPLSARTAPALAACARAYVDLLRPRGAEDPAPALRDICYSAALRRTHDQYRLAVAGRDQAELREKLAEFIRGEAGPGPSTLPATERTIAFVFCGQGPQWWAMGRQLLEHEPVFHGKIAECDALVREMAGWSLLAELTAE